MPAAQFRPRFLAGSTSPRFAVALVMAVVLGATDPDVSVGAPSLGKGWTHIAGTDDHMLFYQSGTGRGRSGPFRLGRFRPAFTGNLTRAMVLAAPLVAATPDCVLIYDPLTGLAEGYRFDDQGRPVHTGRQLVSAGWTHIVGTTGALLFYRADSGLAGSGTIDDECIFSPKLQYGLSAGWTHIVGTVPDDSLLFYNAASGLGAGGRLADTGQFTSVSTYDFDPGWTHLAASWGGQVVFYDRASGNAAFGELFGGGFHQIANHRFAKGWTHVAGGDILGFIFYDRKSGKGIGGYFDAIDGEWQRTRRYG